MELNVFKDRKSFCRDVVTTFIEGYREEWCQVEEYDWADEEARGGFRADGGPKKLPEKGGEPYARAICLFEPAKGEQWWRITVDENRVAQGLERLGKSPVPGLHENYRGEIISAVFRDEAGDIDYERASWIIQIAVYGDVLYS